MAPITASIGEYKTTRLKDSLERLYREYDFKRRIKHDPISFPLRYSTQADMEAAAFISQALAYGKVGMFMPVIDRILGLMGSSPAQYLLNMHPNHTLQKLDGLSYRFNSTADITALLYMLGNTLKQYGTLEAAFMRHFSLTDPNTGPALEGFISNLLATDTTAVYGENIKPRGLRQLLPSPSGGSACKRLNLFMRWMVRTADTDFGLWREVPQDKLIIPLDTHIERVARCLGLTDRNSNNWRTAVEITQRLAELDPTDPLKYDFALCHRGISGQCGGAACEECELCGLR